MSDPAILAAAFQRIKDLSFYYEDAIPWAEIAQGFSVNGERVLFANRAQGIFKPRQMKYGALSIKTVMPKQGRRQLYSDQAYTEDHYRYDLQRGDSRSSFNQLIWQSKERNQPLIYFYAVAPSVYTALWPCFIGGVHATETEQAYCDVYLVEQSVPKLPTLVGDQNFLPDVDERRYAIRESRVRLHQSSFRQAVLEAYDTRCAMTGLPTHHLLDAAHIIPDSKAEGIASVNNGLALSKLHHSAYDKNLIGIDADYRIHVAEQILQSQDGPLLEVSIKGLHGQLIRMPTRRRDHPNRDFLARRFGEFLDQNSA